MSNFGVSQLRGAYAAGFATAHGVEYPTGDPKRRKALQEIHENEFLKDILRIEPSLIPLVEAAKYQQNADGYNRIRTYTALKKQVIQLVGCLCKTPEIMSSKHYSCVMGIIADLLPADDVDLYPNGKTS